MTKPLAIVLVPSLPQENSPVNDGQVLHGAQALFLCLPENDQEKFISEGYLDLE